MGDNCLHLVSPMPPSVNHYLGRRGFIKNGKAMSSSYKKKDAVSYQEGFKEHVREQVKLQGWKTDPDYSGHFYVDAVFYMNRRRRDANNMWKCMLDAITDTKLVWKDDSIVCERNNGILYDTDNPRVELTIRNVDYVGIFDNQKQLNEFEKNCSQCKRYKRNCSLLQRAKAGYIQPEINNFTCLKYVGYKGE